MSSTTPLRPPQVRWDLSALFSGMDDPKIVATWDALDRRAEAFEATYRGRIDSAELDAATLLAALTEVESISAESSKPLNYASLLHACDAASPEIGAFMQKQMERGSALSVQTMFFHLELQAAPEEAITRALEDPRLANYVHFTKLVRALSPHSLSEAEEIILEETANTGCRAWVRLFEEVTSTHPYPYRNPTSGEQTTLSQEEILDKLRDADRAIRQAAADGFTEGLEDLQRVLVFTYNNLIQDKKVEDRLRDHPYPEHSRHLANELDKPTVDLVMRLCKDHYNLVARYYKVKRQILGLDQLTHIDRYAPLFEAEGEVPWDEAVHLVSQSFGEFHPQLGASAKEFADKQWIDAEPRPGKRGGAFCSYNTPDTHPVVFLSYLNKLDDVMTLAHELGHGVHASLSREQSYVNFHGTLPLAELASTFGEMLVFEKLVAKATPQDRLALYADKIEGVFATVFRQAAMFRFEQQCHETVRAEGELPGERFAELWQTEIQAMFGDSLTLGEQHRTWWSYVSHFVAVPFYVYAYSFGELLVLALYQRGKEEGEAFANRYVDLLRLGGSRSPQELMATVGVDLTSETFWQGGFAAIERLVEQFEALWAEVGTSQQV
ncbi:MAG: M3 family oligoendopeptidase [Fimbriimonadaceae bacterium]|nr:M3 family oligoendopeptidase [Chthonomonadaceae bacterium]MCO5296751.1 M3 family oligoendopeptidase [Fimbriimonadaceae bacterium]